MSHLHEIIDSDNHFAIDPVTRLVTNNSEKVKLVQYDHNSERFTFQCPRMIEGHDMSLSTSVRVQYINLDKRTKRSIEGVYEVADLAVSNDDPSTITFSWLISRNATQFVGNLNFLIEFRCLSEDNSIDYAWHTDIYNGSTNTYKIGDMATAVESISGGGTSDISLGLTSATVSQIAKISAVDDNGVPTAWEAVDMSSGCETWELIRHILIPDGAAETNTLTINTDDTGNTFALKKLRLTSKFPAYTGASTIPNFSFTMLNDFTSGAQSPLCYTSGLPTPNAKQTPTGWLEVDLTMPGYQVERVARFAGSGGMPAENLYYSTRRLNNADSIFSVGGTNMLIYPGCEFYLYGVRA